MPLPTKNQLKHGLSKAQQRKTAQTLGDRSTYVGASDIAQCPRKAVLSKTVPRAPSLKDLIRFERGHIAEEIVAAALQDINPDHQVEIAADIPYCPACHWWDYHTPAEPMHCPDCRNPLRLLPLKAHCDIVLGNDLVVECKSSALAGIRDSWLMQLQMQLTLYEHCLGASPQGAVLVIDLARGKLEMSDLQDPDPYVAADLVQRAITIWERVEEATLVTDTETLDIKTEPGPLCGCCDYLATCPAFMGEHLPDDLVGFFEKYLDLCRTEKETKAQKEALRDHVLDLLQPGKYIAGDLRVALFERSRTSTDMAAISALLTELGQDITEYQNKTPYKVLDVKAA